jgi:RNA polymerase sigma-70 factor (ECF subfamily)
MRHRGVVDDFGALYDEHADGLLRFFARRTLDPEAALDLVAETFARTIELQRRLPAGSEERAKWLYGIANKLLLTYWRKGRVERRALSRLGIEPPALSEESLRRVEDLASLSGMRAAVREAVAALPAGQRHALELRLIEELPYPQVAARLGIAEAAARARVSRAVRALHLHLAEAGR